MVQNVYLNYAATSIQKPQPVIDEVCRYLQFNNQFSDKRSYGNQEDELVFTGREVVNDFFHGEDSARVIFTSNVTLSLNMVLNGLLQPGDHVITSTVEHNAVSRPLYLLEKKGVALQQVSCSPDGQLCLQDVEKAFQPNTKVLVLTHASNVLGTILPIKECFAKAQEKGIITVLDIAQTAGFLPLDMQELHADVLAFTGHKSLYALSGIGGFLMSETAAKKMQPWLTGGTGSLSHSKEQPNFLPDRFESGTLNSIGILSLTKSIEWLQEIGLENIQKKEQALYDYFLAGLQQLPLRILGTQKKITSVPILSVVPDKMPVNELGDRLFHDYQIVTRCGLHCAPDAHQTVGTFETGALRFSLGYENTEAEISYTLKALQEVLR